MTDHLKGNRTLIISRALVAGAAGLVPVPYIDDLLAGAVRAALIRRLAEIRRVDVDANAVDELAHPHGSRIMQAASFGAIALGATRRVFRKVAASLLLVRRVDEAVQTFLLGSLFDHYCAKHHVGLGVDGKQAAMIRHAMDMAVKKTRGEALKRVFQQALKTSGTLVVKLPRTALSVFSRRRGGSSLDDRLDAAAESAPVRRALAGVEAEMAAVEPSTLASLLSAFDLAWAALLAPKPESPGA
jgi:hypothetical protein